MKSAMGYIQWGKIKLCINKWYPSRNRGLIVLKIPVRFTQIAYAMSVPSVSSKIKPILHQKIEVMTGVKVSIIEIPPTYSAVSPKDKDGFICVNARLDIVGEDDFWTLFGYFGGIK